MTLFEMLDYASKLGLEGLHLDARALDQMDPDYLEKVKYRAADLKFYLEYNFALKSGHYDASVQHDIDEGVAIAHAIGADVVKIGMNLKRPRPIAAGKFHPDMMVQLEMVAGKVIQAIDLLEQTGIKAALENHTDTFSEEVIWVLDRVDHPLVGPVSIWKKMH